MKPRVLLADVHPFARSEARCAVAANGIEVVGEASHGRERFGLLDAARCDAAVADLTTDRASSRAMPEAAGDACAGVSAYPARRPGTADFGRPFSAPATRHVRP